MSTPIAERSIPTQLRNEAEARLEAGTAAASNWSLGVDALYMLHRLSSDPQTAADALKLLHELQVHQVELDLQNEEMRVNEQHFVDELVRYKALYDFAPFAYFLVDFQGGIIEINRAGAELLGVEREEFTGGSIVRFLATESRPVLLSLLADVVEDGGTLSCEVIVEGEANNRRPLRVAVNAFADKRSALLTFRE